MDGSSDDQVALCQFAHVGSADAFERLVRRHADWVYGCALRQVRNAADAQDVTQAAFVLLSRKAGLLHEETRVSSWLFKVVRFEAMALRRARRRRERHERAAAAQRRQTSEATPADDGWAALAPLLDEAVARLPESDRRSVLLRFYERRTFAEVGAALRVSEEAARKRVARAVDKLRQRLLAMGCEPPAGPWAAVLAGADLPGLAARAPAGLAATPPSAAALELAAETRRLMALHRVALIGGVGAAALALAAAGVVVLAMTAGAPAASAPVAAAAATRPADAASTRPATLRGRVVDYDGKPVPNARVWATHGGTEADRPAVELRADAAGTFSVDATPDADEPPSRWPPFRNAIVHADGFGWGAGKLTGSRQLDVELPPPTRQRVRYLDPAGAPVAGMRVRVARLTPDGDEIDSTLFPTAAVAALLERTTDADGVATWDGLPRGWSLETGWDDDRFAGSYGFTSPVVLADTDEGPVQTVTLRPGVSITGRVTLGEGGPPAAGVRLTASSEQVTVPPVTGFVNAYATTDADGRFALRHLLPSTYRISASLIGTPLSARYVGGPVASTAVGAGEHSTDNDFALPLGVIVSGSARLADGRPAAGAIVRAEDAEARADGDGRFSIPLLPGKRTVSVASADRRAAASVTLDVDAAHPPTLDVSLQPEPAAAGAARGRVTFEDGTPAAGARLILTLRGGGRATSAAEEDGTFMVSPSREVVSVSARLGTLRSAATADPRGPTLTLVPDRRQPLGGTVADPAGKPIVGAKVDSWVEPGMVAPAGTALTDAQGRYAFRRMRPDASYRLRVQADGYARVWRTAKPGDAGTDFVLAIADGVIAGRAVGPDGKPLADVEVAASGRGTPWRSVRAAADGSFKLDRIAKDDRLNVEVFRDGVSLGKAQARAGQTDLTVTCDDAPPTGP